MKGKVKTLIVAVDRDDDLGKKTKIKGPVLGEEKCIKAAESLAIADPGESDANAMFAAVKTYRELKKNKEKVEIAIVTGHPSRGVKADREVRRQLEELKSRLGYEEVILVSDGADDEQLIPVIQGITRIANIQTVIVKQAKEIEKSYYVIKEILRDPHFARIIFGLPGIVMLTYALVYILGIERISLNVILGLLGFYLLIKGFGIEDAFMRWFSSFKKTTSMERASFPIYIASILIILMSIWSGLDYANYISKQLWLVGRPNLAISVIAFFLGTLGLLTLAAILFLAGRIVDMYYRGEVMRIKGYARSMVTTVAAYLILDTSLRFVLAWASTIITGPTFIDILFTVILAILVTLFGFSVITSIYKKLLGRHIKKGSLVHQDSRVIGRVVSVDVKRGMINISSEGGEEKMVVSLSRVERLAPGEIEIV